MNLTIRQLFLKGQDILTKAQVNSCAFDGWELLGFCLDKTKNYLMLNQDEIVSEDNIQKYITLCEKRATGYPLQYILGSWEFFGLEFKVGYGVLIPRADTETLVETVLELDFKKDGGNILDLCSGSGAIAVSLGVNIPQCNVDAVELSDTAYSYLCQNVKMAKNVTPFHDDILYFDPDKKYDVITANPPYITHEEMQVLQKEVTFEPIMALEAADDGLYFYKNITELYKEYLIEGGYLVYEIGYKQKEKVENILKENGFKDIKTIKDLGGNDRVVLARK